jgi:cytochrome c oxidase assembly factor CtaG
MNDMHPLLQALFSQWEWRLEILIPLGLLAAIYTAGWLNVRRRRHGHSNLANYWRLAAYWIGVLVLMTSLMSPIDVLGGQLFFMHMIQHLLTMMIAAPLIWLSNPFPIGLWGLPPRLRMAVASLFMADSWFRRGLVFLTRPSTIWFLYLVIYLGWHEPALYNLALRRDGVHDLQHITFFAGAMLYWWHVTGAGPRLHGHFPLWARIVYLLAMIPPNMIAGVMIALSPEVLYTYYETVPRIWGYTVLQDQMTAGVIMWIPGSMMFLLAALILVAKLLSGEDGSTPAHHTSWEEDETLIAPGLENRVIQNRWQRMNASHGQLPDGEQRS